MEKREFRVQILAIQLLCKVRSTNPKQKKSKRVRAKGVNMFVTLAFFTVVRRP